MSSINDAINNLNKAAFDATQTTDFYSKVADGSKTDVITNPVSGVAVPSFQKMVNDIYNDQDVVAQAAASAASAEHFADVAEQEAKKFRPDSASQLGLVYLADWVAGLVIPNDAAKDKLAIWHNGQFYSIGTDTGFTSNDFDADLAAGRFVSVSAVLLAKTRTYTTVQLMTLTLPRTPINTSGYYDDSDGGCATWIPTGIVSASKKSTHDKLNRNIYDAVGNEFTLSALSGGCRPIINAKANGMKCDVVTTSDGSQVVSGTDDSDALIGAANFVKWSIFKHPEDAIGTMTSEGAEIHIPQGSILLTDTLPVRSFLTYVSSPYTAVYFRPTSKKSIFAINIDELKAVYNSGEVGAQSWNTLTANYFGVIDGLFQGDALPGKSRADTMAEWGMNAQNVRYGQFSNCSFIRCNTNFELGGLDTSSWTGGSRIGNFYENSLDKVSLKDGRLNLQLRGNVTSLVNCSIGNFYQWTVDKPEYLVRNTGSGNNFSGCGIAPMSLIRNPTKAIIYDACRGSSYAGNYSEHFKVLFELDPYPRFGGFTYNAGNYKFVDLNTGVLFKFTDGKIPWYDFENYTFDAVDIGGTWNHLNWSGLQIGSMYQQLTDYFEYAPAYDFRYGLYGVRVGNAVVPHDVLRTGDYDNFINGNGIVIYPQKDMDILLPISNRRWSSNVVMVYKTHKGDFDGESIKLSVLEAPNNEYITVGVDTIDYGNGYKMAVVRSINPNKGKGNVTLSVKSGDQVEICIIAAYQNGFPIFPQCPDFVPRTNLKGTIQGGNGNTYPVRDLSGGTFQIGDVVGDFVSFGGNLVQDPTPVNPANTMKKAMITNTSGSNWYTLNRQPTDVSTTLYKTLIDVPFTNSNCEYVGVGRPIVLSDGREFSVKGREYLAGNFTGKLIVREGISGLESITVSQQNIAPISKFEI